MGGILGIIGLLIGEGGGSYLLITDEGQGRPGFVTLTPGGVLRVVGFFLFGAGTLILLVGFMGSI